MKPEVKLRLHQSLDRLDKGLDVNGNPLNISLKLAESYLRAQQEIRERIAQEALSAYKLGGRCYH